MRLWHKPLQAGTSPGARRRDWRGRSTPTIARPPAPHNAFLDRPNVYLGRGTPSVKKGGEDIEKHAGPTSETVLSRALDSWHSP